MLPPSQFGGDGPSYDDMENKDVFGSKDRYDIILGGLEYKNYGAAGFDIETWMQGITDIRDYVISINNDDEVEVSFTFDFDIGDGDYTGTRYVSYTY